MTALDTAACLPLLCPPRGPGTPFGTPLIAALDTVRLACWIASLYVVTRCIHAIYRIRTRQQRAIYVALALFAFATLGTEIDHLGDLAHYRLIVNIAGAATACYGLRSIRDHVRDWTSSR
jgi:hypothetical protein